MGAKTGEKQSRQSNSFSSNFVLKVQAVRLLLTESHRANGQQDVLVAPTIILLGEQLLQVAVIL